MEKIEVSKVVLILRKIEYNGNNDVINIACGKYEIPTFKKILSNMFRRFKKVIIINE